MPRLLPEPQRNPDGHGRTAVLLINLGTPDEPKAPAVRRYLREFLSDPRVVEIPRLLWWPVLNGIILNVRPKKSAEKYAAIWTPEGSPLKVHTERQVKLLRGFLGQSGHALHVDYAMRYGQPSIPATLSRLKAAGFTRILLLPLYPQYSSSTTATAFDRAFAWAGSLRNQPELRTVRSFPDNPDYIEALAASVRQHWMTNGQPDASYRLVMSFHGIPERNVRLGDPYADQCQATARLLAEALGLAPEQYLLTFQSRFGKAKWLEPYTEPTLVAMAQGGLRRVDVMCPGFTGDCLETLEEISIEARDAFIAAGGKEFRYIPCLNDDGAWITALRDIAQQHLAGWPTARGA